MADLTKISGRTRVVGVIGNPVRHSLSPVIHNAGFRSTGVDFVYVAFDVAAGSAKVALDALRVLDIAGLSVTMPHKADVALAVDELGESARSLDSVNTVEVRTDGLLVGHSTDGDGLVASLQYRNVNVGNQRVVVFGAGGAARSVIDALARHGVTSLSVVNRTLDTAQRAVELARGRGEALSSADIESVSQAVATADIVINATSVGMGSMTHEQPSQGNLPLDPTWLRTGHTVVDLVYHPIDTPLLRAASAQGCNVIDGLGMLVHQAALQQVIWTARHPDIDEMTSAARQALL